MDNRRYPRDDYDYDYDYEYDYPDYKLAHAYVPYQRMCRVYDAKEALRKGTLFPELYMPYKKYDKKKKC